MFWQSSISPGRYRGVKHRLKDAEDVFDVVVCGAGPCGAACAYYLSKYGSGLFAGAGLRVALLDKATFPRDKYCGDAWCKFSHTLCIYKSMVLHMKYRCARARPVGRYGGVARA